MILLIGVFTFVFCALGLMSLFWFLEQPSTAGERLRRLGVRAQRGGRVISEPEGPTLVERVATPLYQLAPPSPAESGKLQKKLMLAGYRSASAQVVYRAIQLVALVVPPSAVALWSTANGYALDNTLLLAILAFVIGFIAPRFVLSSMIKGRQQRLRWGLTDALDLMVISVDAGLGLDAAIQRVAKELKKVHRDISDEFELVNLEIRVGRQRDEALRNLAERTGVDDLHSLVAMLIQADRFGTSITRSIRIYADSMRTKRRQRAEQAAQKAALKLMFPLTCFLFPAFLIVLFTPPVLGLLESLGSR